MRRLDVVLAHASERGQRTGPDLLIEHLEQRLHGERAVVVATRTRRDAMVKTEERTTPTEKPRQPWKRWAFALVGLAVAVAAVVVAVVLIGGGDDEAAAPQTPTEVMVLLATAVEAADPGQFTNLTSPVNAGDGEAFLEWNLALGMDPDFSDCAVTSSSASASMVRCDVTMGEDYFFSVVLDQDAPTSVTVRVAEDGTFDVVGWPPPSGLVQVESEMRAWIQTAHPEVENRMFGNDYGDIRFSKEAGELHSQYLDEYLDYLG